jgi:hypothetical protein
MVLRVCNITGGWGVSGTQVKRDIDTYRITIPCVANVTAKLCNRLNKLRIHIQFQKVGHVKVGLQAGEHANYQVAKLGSIHSWCCPLRQLAASIRND